MKNTQQKCWYVLYTCPRSERMANKKLNQLGVTTFLPLHTVVKQWSDRKKKIDVPLFPNYIFINCFPYQRSNVLRVRELVKFVSFEGKPAVVSDEIIFSLKNILEGEVEISLENSFYEGVKVRILDGQFSGAEGILIRKNGKNRLLVGIEALNTRISVDISSNHVEQIDERLINIY